MPVTKDQAILIAELAAAARPFGARRWDIAGIVAAIRPVAQMHLADVILAAIRAADDHTLDTPAAIGNTKSSCWRERGTDRPTTTDARICPQHAVQFHGPICPSCKADSIAQDADQPPADHHRQHEPKRPLRELVQAASEETQ